MYSYYIYTHVYIIFLILYIICMCSEWVCIYRYLESAGSSRSIYLLRYTHTVPRSSSGMVDVPVVYI